MPTSEQDLLYIEKSFPELKSYLLSDILYYPLTGNLPRLTIGGLLLAKKRLQAENLGTHLSSKLTTVKRKWYVAWTKKAARELDSRLTLWRNYLNDYRANPENYVADYKSEVRLRVMLELLSEEVGETPTELIVFDELLRVKLTSSDFIWDKTLQSEFDQEKFWFLYGKL